MPAETPPGPDPAEVAWARSIQYAEELAAALDALEESRGLGRLAGRMKPAALAKAIRSLAAARAALSRDARPARAGRDAAGSARARGARRLPVTGPHAPARARPAEAASPARATTRQIAVVWARDRPSS